ncbi:MAG: MarR family transcriptional regulator [Oscillospiraceae bacterium]|nr:MarR family transcriptional regulator [Oscillospiraceae bacterium]
MRSTPYENSRRDPFDPMDIAGLQQWQRQQQQDNRAQIERLLAKLPVAVDQELTPRQRQILMMHFHDGMRVTDIARELGVSKSVVSRTLGRCTERLFRVLRYSL